MPRTMTRGTRWRGGDMKDILIEGHRILTTDDIADAVLSYARALLERGGTDIVEFPSFHEGNPTLCAPLP